MGRRKARSGQKPRTGPPVDVDLVIAREREARDRCASKRTFETEAEARSIIAMHRAYYGETQIPYQCEFCRQWHLATQRPPEGR